MKEYKRCLNMVRKHLNEKTIKLDEEKLDKLVEAELEKPINKMDTHLIDLCLNALVAYRTYMSERENKT